MTVSESATRPLSDPHCQAVPKSYLLAADARTVNDADADRDFGHRLVLSRFGGDLSDGLRLLWRVVSSGIVVISPVAPKGTLDGTPIVRPEPGARLRIRAQLEAVARNYPDIDPRVAAALRGTGYKLPRIDRTRVRDDELVG
ncbi:MAG: hypothetical protein WAV90_12815, partial [Gordonia amarae]